MFKPILSIIFIALAGLTLTQTLLAQGWSQTDFIVADQGSSRIAVYDQNFVFQRYLSNPPNEPWGLTILSNGDIAVVGRSPSEIRIYNQSGALVNTITDPNIGNPVDIKASANNLYVGQDSLTGGIAEFTTSGTFNHVFGSGTFFSDAVVPGNKLWAGGQLSTISVFDLSTDTLSNTITLDSGQQEAISMYYSPVSNTVLTLGGRPSFTKVYERDLTGTYIREFTVPVGDFVNVGVVRGPNNDIFATRLNPAIVHRWSSTGTYITSIDLSSNVTQAANIIWMGNFAPSAAGVRVAGRVTDQNGNGIPNAAVNLSGSSGVLRVTRVNQFGYFSFDDVAAGESYIVSVSHKSYQFSPRIINVNDELTDLNFTPISQETTVVKKRRL